MPWKSEMINLSYEISVKDYMLFTEKLLKDPIDINEEIFCTCEEITKLDDTRNDALERSSSRRKRHRKYVEVSSSSKRKNVVNKKERVDIINIDDVDFLKVDVKWKKTNVVHEDTPKKHSNSTNDDPFDIEKILKMLEQPNSVKRIGDVCLT